MKSHQIVGWVAALQLLTAVACAEVCNLKVVTDASPDYSDLPSLVHSIAAKWPTPQEKCWAVFYWNHIARRQTAPMDLHGMALTDPIRQFNDYGYTMCSTISGINQSIWEHMGLKHRYWDISNHTVPEVFYDGRWHMYDNSMSAIYTLCDGKTIAGVEDIGRPGACAASGGKVEPGHVARYHCLTATSPNGFLSGADTARSLEEEYRCFNPNGLKLRTYFYDWDFGHRYILNLKNDESYTRYYHSLGDGKELYVPNHGKDPDAANKRYHIRGNGVWEFFPKLTAEGIKDALYSSDGIEIAEDGGLHPARAKQMSEAVFRIQSANVTTSQVIEARFDRKSIQDDARILISTTNGLHWEECWKADTTGNVLAKTTLFAPVNGAYEILVKVQMRAANAPADVVLRSIHIQTTTQLNAKTQPRLNLGKNTIYIGAGDQTDSIVFWPELHGGKYKQLVVEEKNIGCVKQHIGYQGAIYPAKAKEDASVVYRLDAPTDMVKLTYGGRFYNRAPKSHIDMSYSLDFGQSWTGLWSLTDTKQPWDVIHYETAAIPAGHRLILVKYLMNTTDPSPSGCSIYALRMEANYTPADTRFKPLSVTFTWKEVQKDRSTITRSHTQLIDKLPTKYTIDVGGEDQPIMESLQIARRTDSGYSDGKDVGGQKFIPKWVTYGKNLATGKTYTLSHPSTNGWGAGDPDGKKLTDGIVGPPYAGGTSYRYGALWNGNTNPTITLDLGQVQTCASFGMDVHGYEFWDALKGQVTDRIEVLISDDGQAYRSIGFLNTDLRWKDLPANYMWPDEETLTGATYRLIPPQPVQTRFVRYKVTSKRFFCATELEVLDSIKFDPFDLKIALPDEK